jgi:hypothetical protein
MLHRFPPETIFDAAKKMPESESLGAFAIYEHSQPRM